MQVRVWGFVAALALGRVAFGFQFQSLASLGPELQQVFTLDYAALGGLIGLYMAPGIVAALPGGLLGRRYGGRLVVGAGLALMALGSLACAFAPGPAGIGAGRVVAGAGAVALVVMQGKLMADRFEGRHFVTVMGAWSSGRFRWAWAWRASRWRRCWPCGAGPACSRWGPAWPPCRARCCC